MNWLANAVNITPPATTGWQTVDLTAQGVPAGAVCIIRWFPSSAVAMGARKVAGDNRVSASISQSMPVLCGVNASSQLDLYKNNANAVYWLQGWFTGSEAAYFDAGINKTPAGTGWQDIDCSLNVPVNTKFAIFEHSNAASTQGINFKKKGSGDLRQPSYDHSHLWYVVGLDTNRLCQVYLEASESNTIYLVGYINYGISNETANDVSLSITGSYQDIDLSALAPSNALAVIIETKGIAGTGQYYGLKPNDHVNDFYPSANGLYYDSTVFDVIALDAGKIIDGKISATSIDFYVHGFITSAEIAPVADFTADVIIGNVPLTVNFSDASTGGTPTYWEWDFGDGSALNYTQNPTHIYNNAGTYTVSLIVSNGYGNDTETKVGYITVINVGTVNITLPMLNSVIESWGISLILPALEIGAGGYWTDYTQMTFPMLRLQAYGYIISNDGDMDLPMLTISSAGLVGLIGTAELTLPMLELTVSEIQQGVSNIILPMLTLSATGSVATGGTAIITLPQLQVSGTGLVGLIGSSIMTLPGLSISGAGIVSLGITGEALLILPSLKVSGTGRIIQAETFQVFLINTKNFAISNYTSFPFNAFAKFGDLYLASSANGIFLLEGSKDDTADINAKFATGLLGMGVDKLKHVIDMILGIKSNGKYDLKVTTDDGVESSYELVDSNATLHPVRQKFGKGKRGKYWKLKIYNKEGSDFEIDSIQSNVNTTSRKI